MATEPITPQPDDSEDKSAFFDFAATMPETADGFLGVPDSPIAGDPESGAEGDGGVAGAPVPPERKRVNVSKSVQKAMKKFRKKAADVPIMWFHSQAKEHPEWELDDEEKDLLKDSIDTVFEVLDVQIEIEPLSWTLTSIWWVLAYPVFAFAFLFLTKKSKQLDKEKDALQQQN